MAERILVLDDVAVFGQLVAVILRASGYEVLLHQNAAAALEAERRYRPRLALLDIDMPGMNGLEVLAELRSRRRPEELRIMMATARGETDFVARAREAGACLYLRKPFSVTQLVRRSQALLAGPHHVEPAEDCLVL